MLSPGSGPPVVLPGVTSAKAQRGVLAALAAMAVVLAATVIVLVATNRSADQARADLATSQDDATQRRGDIASTSTDLEARRVELATLLNRLQQSDDYLGVRTDSRNQIAESVDRTRSELFTLSGALRDNYVTVFFQEKQSADLDSCITKANQALNVLSHGDREAGKSLLAESNKGCQAVNDYLATRGITP